MMEKSLKRSNTMFRENGQEWDMRVCDIKHMYTSIKTDAEI